jgi:uncharacterized protein (DUF39 family)
MKKMNAEFVRGVSLKGYGVSLALGVGIPIPILDRDILAFTTVRDRDIFAPVIDYSHEYPQKTGRIIGKVNYEQLKTGEIILQGKKVETGSLSSYSRAREIATLVGDEIRRGEFLLHPPLAPLPQEQSMKSLEIRGTGDE